MNETTKRRVLNAYRTAAAQTADAVAQHRAHGNTPKAHDAYRQAAQLTRAAAELHDRERNSQ